MAYINWTKWQLEMVQRIVNVENSNTCKGGDIKGEAKERERGVEKNLEERKKRGEKEKKKKKREIHSRIINLP